ncbi:hypothetical protein SteCoe_7138 [Stentor coeruleus]|uniref:Peptidase A1 domain-containing protein n=1 Tax=Stentor coeruleus TaxID=5963 RepID=A0A1R2CN48_9CILI|nr:hypothetical protein SteCoe_7138 [Stentor coeruleus]
MKFLVSICLIGMVLGGPGLEQAFKDSNDMDVLSGFLSGLGISDTVSQCFGEKGRIIEKLSSGFENIESSSTQHVFNGVKKVADTFKNVPKHLARCDQNYALIASRIDKALRTISKPKTLTIVPGESILINDIEVLPYLTTAINNLDAGDYFTTGQTLAGLVNNFMPANLKGLNFNQVMDIIGGFFVGMATDVNATDVAPCVTNAGVFGGWIEQSIIDFSKHTFDGTKDGFMDLSNAFGALPGFVKKCVPAAVETAAVVEKAAVAWAHPLSLLYHVGLNIIFNGQEIFADISKAMGDFQSGNWYGFGFDIGQAAFKIIYVPKKEVYQTIDEDIVMIMEGALAELGETGMGCVVVPDISSQLVDMVENWELKTFIDAKNSLTNMAEALNVIIPTVQTCVSEKTLSLLNIGSSTLNDPYSFVYMKEGKVAVINGRQIGFNMKIAVINYNMQDWKGFGYYLAKILKDLA